MKMMRIFDIRGLILILGAVLGVSVGFASPAFAQTSHSVIVNPDGSVISLGYLNSNPSGGYYFTSASGINDSGQVVGGSETASLDYHAFITGPNGMGMTDLGTLNEFDIFTSHASGINDSGQVAGSSQTAYVVPGAISSGPYHAFVTGPNGMGMTDLGTLGGNESLAYGINDSGQVVGRSDTADGPWHAFMTGPDGMGMIDLGTLGGSYSEAHGINNAGQVVGWSETADGFTRAFITGPDGMGMTDLGAPGGGDSYATGINNSGQVVGYSYTTGADHSSARASFITGPDGMGMTDLGTLGGNYSAAYGINDSGQVVGFSTTKELDWLGHSFHHAFITGANGEGMTDLNSIADLPDGFYLRRADGINNLGQVIATQYIIHPPIPEPASYALMLAGLGLVGFMTRRKSAAGNIVARS